MNNKIDIFITGKPCSLKDTASSYLSSEFGLTHLRVSSLIKENLIKKYGEDCKEIQKINSGEINFVYEVTDMLISYVKDNLMNNYLNIDIIYDGYPRSLDQWKYHLKNNNFRNNNIKIFLFMKVSDEESINRALKRIVCNSCNRAQCFSDQTKTCMFCLSKDLIKRVDDNEKTILKRLDVYNRITKELEDIQTDEKQKIYVYHIDTEKINDLKTHLHNIIIKYYGK